MLSVKDELGTFLDRYTYHLTLVGTRTLPPG